MQQTSRTGEAMPESAKRCWWAGDDALYTAYHDREWGFPVRDDRRPDEALALSKDLKRRGFTFVGPITVYAFMQAMGLVNDHVDRCPIRAAAETARAAFARPRAAA
jgi:3-methyladenine DNA glycosylase Tag